MAEKKPTINERLEKAGIYYVGAVYFVHGLGEVVRIQDGPIYEKRGQNGVTKDQLKLIEEHATKRKDL